jgi:hypothetical protein
MLAAMRQVVVLVGLALAVRAGAAPRAGKVVRVERGPRTPTGTPRLCKISSEARGICFGKKPEIGDRMFVVDAVHVAGQVRIATVEEYPALECATPEMWAVEGQVESGDLSRPSGDLIGVLDVPLDRRAARQLAVDHSPSAVDQETVIALDTNGDGNADVEFTQYTCDDKGMQSGNATGVCFEVWVHTPHGFDRVRQDRIKNCL